jgi:hypothetical protein
MKLGMKRWQVMLFVGIGSIVGAVALYAAYMLFYLVGEVIV